MSHRLLDRKTCEDCRQVVDILDDGTEVGHASPPVVQEEPEPAPEPDVVVEATADAGTDEPEPAPELEGAAEATELLADAGELG